MVGMVFVVARERAYAVRGEKLGLVEQVAEEPFGPLAGRYGEEVQRLRGCGLVRVLRAYE
jgi:hypothetical protein